MNESEMRTRVVQLLAPLAAFRLENMMVGERELGTPDVCCTGGWLELKLASRAKRDDRLLVKVRPAQRLWHQVWRQSGGRSWFLTLLDEREWLLHDGEWAAIHLGSPGVTIAETERAARQHWIGEPSASRLTAAIAGRMTP